MAELSTIFLNFRYFFKFEPVQSMKTLEVVNELAFFIAYTITRIFYWPFVVFYSFTLDNLMFWQYRSTGQKITCSIHYFIIIAMMVMSFIWYYDICKQGYTKLKAMTQPK